MLFLLSRTGTFILCCTYLFLFTHIYICMFRWIHVCGIICKLYIHVCVYIMQIFHRFWHLLLFLKWIWRCVRVCVVFTWICVYDVHATIPLSCLVSSEACYHFRDHQLQMLAPFLRHLLFFLMWTILSVCCSLHFTSTAASRCRFWNWCWCSGPCTVCLQIRTAEYGFYVQPVFDLTDCEVCKWSSWAMPLQYKYHSDIITVQIPQWCHYGTNTTVMPLQYKYHSDVIAAQIPGNQACVTPMQFHDNHCVRQM